MAMAKKAAVKKTVAKKTVKKSDWSNDMTKGQKSAARKAFSRKMSYDQGAPNSVIAADKRGTLKSLYAPEGMNKVGRKLMAQSVKSAKRAAANPSDVKAARSSGYSKAAAVQSYAANTRRSTKRKRGE